MITQIDTRKNILKFLVNWAAVLSLIACFLVFSAVKGGSFLSANNMVNILWAMAINTVFGIAATITMAPDGFDMSRGYAGKLLRVCVRVRLPLVRVVAWNVRGCLYSGDAGDVSAYDVSDFGL